MKRLALLVGVAVAFLTAGTAYGQNCRPGFVTPTYVNTPTYYQKPVVKEIIREVVQEVQVPIAYPVLVPAFQFQYSPPCFAPSPTYPGQFAPVAPGGYGAPGGGYAAPAPGGYAAPQMPQQQPQGGNLYGAPQQDRIKDLAKALLDEMRRQAETEQNGDGPPVVFDPNAPQVPQPKTPQNPIQPIQSPIQNPGLTKDAARPLALNALARACAQCHTGIGSKGDVVIFSQPGLLSPDAPLKSMRREIDAGRMPPRSFNYRLTPEELQALRIWLPAAKE